MTDRRHLRNFTELEVGGWYERQDGLIDKIIENDGHHTYPFKSLLGVWVTKEGDASGKSENHPHDFIKRVKVVDWDAPSDATQDTDTNGSIFLRQVREHYKVPPVPLADKLASEMTMREYMAMEMIKKMSLNPDLIELSKENCAKIAVNIVDTLINAMERGQDATP